MASRVFVGVSFVVPFAASSATAPDHGLGLNRRIELTARVEEVYSLRRASSGSPNTAAVAVDRAAIAGRVAQSLRATAALSIQFKRPLRPDQVQREIERIVRNSRRPDILAEIWTALDDDPQLFAEIVARPTLADRLARAWFARDPTIHAATRRTAEASLRPTVRAFDLAALTSARVDFAELTLTTSESDAHSAASAANDSLAKVAEALGLTEHRGWPAAAGTRSALLEDDRSFYSLGVLSVVDQKARIVRATWDKLSFETWLDSLEMPADALELSLADRYRRPQGTSSLAAASCSGEGWSPLAYRPEGRGGVAWVWTGSELVIWGGLDVILLNFGDRYDPAIDRWTPMTTRGAPSPRDGAVATWTGSEVVIWGGRGVNVAPLGNGGRYDPMTDTWRPMADSAAPEARSQHRMVFTGAEVIVWGGFGVSSTGALNSGGRYDPVADAWTPTSLGANVPEARGSGFAMVWTGSEMLVWGGCGSTSPCELQNGGRYVPSTDTWLPISLIQAPSPRRGHAYTWTGSELFVWGGCQPSPSGICTLAPRLATGGSTTRQPTPGGQPLISARRTVALGTRRCGRGPRRSSGAVARRVAIPSSIVREPMIAADATIQPPIVGS